VSLRLLKQRQLKPGGYGLVRGAYPPLSGRGTPVRVYTAWGGRPRWMPAA